MHILDNQSSLTINIKFTYLLISQMRIKSNNFSTLVICEIQDPYLPVMSENEELTQALNEILNLD